MRDKAELKISNISLTHQRIELMAQNTAPQTGQRPKGTIIIYQCLKNNIKTTN